MGYTERATQFIVVAELQKAFPKKPGYGRMMKGDEELESDSKPKRRHQQGERSCGLSV